MPDLASPSRKAPFADDLLKIFQRVLVEEDDVGIAFFVKLGLSPSMKNPSRAMS
jgi:hypothetical protein